MQNRKPIWWLLPALIASLGFLLIIACIFIFEIKQLFAFYRAFGLPLYYLGILCFTFSFLPAIRISQIPAYIRQQIQKIKDDPVKAFELVLPLLVCVLMVGLMWLFYPPRFKIFADELNMVGISQAIFFEKEFYIASSGYTVEGEFFSVGQVWGRHTVLFPVLISWMHFILGYDPHNSFLVNAIAGVFILYFAYRLVLELYDKTTAWITLPLMASFPILVFCITSGLLATINLTFIFLVLWLTVRLCLQPKVDHYEQLLWSCALLSQLRYESAFFALVLIPVITLCMPRQQLAQLPKRLLLLPLVFLPTLIQRLINFHNFKPFKFSGAQARQDQSNFYSDIVEGIRGFDPGITPGESSFSWANLVENIESHYKVLFDSEVVFIPYLTHLAVAGLILLGFRIAFKKRTKEQIRAVTLPVAVLLGLAGVMMIYRFGAFHDYTQYRLALIYIPLVLILIAGVLHPFIGRIKPLRLRLIIGVGLTLGMWYAIYHQNTLANQISDNELTYIKMIELMEQMPNPEKRMVISSIPIYFSIHGYASFEFIYAAKHYEFLKSRIREKQFDSMHVFYSNILGKRLKIHIENQEILEDIEAAELIERLNPYHKKSIEFKRLH